MMIAGWGVAVDRVISDFSNGTCEWLTEQGEERGDWVIVEGQGSLDHPAYSAVTLGLIHGCTPQALVMVHKPGLAEHDFDHVDRRVLPDQAAARVHPPPRGGGRARRPGQGRRGRPEHVALRGRGRRATDRRRDRGADTGLPADDPVRFGPDRLWAAIRPAVEALVP